MWSWKRKRDEKYTQGGGYWDGYYDYDYDGYYKKSWKGDSYYDPWKDYTYSAKGTDGQNAILDMSAFERLLFLSKLWSGKPSVNIQDQRRIQDYTSLAGEMTHPNDKLSAGYMEKTMSPCSNLSKEQIFLPTMTQMISQLGGVSKLKDEPYGIWRILRYLDWHESQHFVYTPPRFMARCANDNIDKEVYNAIEDGRVNKLGTLVYPGMISEEKFYNELTDAALMMISPILPTIVPDKAAMFKYAFTSKMCGSSIEPYRPWLSDEELAKMDEIYGKMTTALEEGESERATQDLAFELAKNVTQWMNGMYKDYGKYHVSAHSATSMAGAPSDKLMNGSTSFQKRSHKEVELGEMADFIRGVREFNPTDMHYDSIAGSRTRAALSAVASPMTSPELKKILEPLRAEAMSTCPDNIKQEVKDMWEEKKAAEKFENILGFNLRGDGNPYGTMATGFESYIDRDVLLRMLSNLRKWRDKHLETICDAGSDIDVEKMIVDELRQVPVDEFYITTEAKNPRDNILFLLDTSGSMSGEPIERYKVALATIATAFEMLRTNYSLFLFNSGFDSRKGYIERLKGFTNRRMSSVEKKITSGLQGSGGTPLDDALLALMKTPEFGQAGYIVICTDGGVGDIDLSSKKLRMSGKDHIYLYLGSHRSAEFESYVHRGTLKKNEYLALPIKDLPKLAVNMVLKGQVV